MLNKCFSFNGQHDQNLSKTQIREESLLTAPLDRRALKRVMFKKWEGNWTTR